jgi:hypothetical protein
VSVGTLSPAAALERLVDGYERLVGGPNENAEKRSANSSRVRSHVVIEGDPV